MYIYNIVKNNDNNSVVWTVNLRCVSERERESAEEQDTADWDLTNLRELGLRNAEKVTEIPTIQRNF